MKTHINLKHKLSTGIGIVCLLLFTSTSVHAQDVTTTETQDSFVVQGIVSDEEGPLPGVNVVLKGTSTGTSTNGDGMFKFPQELKKGDVLIFSHISMESKRVVIENANSATQVEMKMDMALAEIVITGAAATKKVYKSKNN